MRILISFLLFFGSNVLAQTYDYIISGGGPGGLASALSLIAAGVLPDRILVIESRSEEADPGNPSRPHGSRSRAVILDEITVQDLERLGVPLQGNALEWIRFLHNFGTSMALNRSQGDDPSFRKNIFGNTRAQRDLVEDVIHRRFDKVFQLGALEKRMLEMFRGRGGQVLFNSKTVLKNHGGGVIASILRDGETLEVTSRYGIVAEGRNSETRANLGIALLPVKGDSSPVYLGADFSSSSRSIPAGALTLFFDREARLIGYGVNNADGGSVGVVLSNREALNDPVERLKYEAMLLVFARDLNVKN